MGIKNPPPTFQRILNSVLSTMLDVKAFVYLDDIIVFSHTLEEHDKRARRLCHRLRYDYLKLQPDKCDFLKIEVASLVHIISKESMKPNLEKGYYMEMGTTPKAHF